MDPRLDPNSSPVADGIALVEASAGTGKTYCLATLVARLVAEGKISDIGRALVVTFTNAATDELALRVRARLAGAARALRGESGPGDTGDAFLASLSKRRDAAALRRTEEALRRFDLCSISTIHGFCKKMLAFSALEGGLPLEPQFLESDAELLGSCANDFWRRRLFGDAELAALAVTRSWSVENFLKDFREFFRYRNARLLPEAPALEAALAEFRATRARAAAAWDEAEFRRFALEAASAKALSTAKDNRAAKLLGGDGLEDFVARLGRAAAGEASCLGAFLEAAESKLAAALKPSKAGALALPGFCRACGELSAAADAAEHAMRGEFLRAVLEGAEREKRRTRSLGFDDLLLRFRDALAAGAAGERLARTVAAQYDAALIDEFQDTDPVQCEIFFRLFGAERKPLFFIGDPKQAIYGFRGADLFAYLGARERAQSRYTLSTNWRASREMVAAVNAVFSKSPQPFVHAGTEFAPAEAAGAADRTPLSGDGGKALAWWWHGPVADESGKARPVPAGEARELAARATAGEIAGLLSRGMRLGEAVLEAGSLAVLVRTHAQAEIVARHLAAAGVPAVISRNGNIYDTEELAELRAAVRALAASGDPAALKAALATALCGFDAAKLAALGREPGSLEAELAEFDRLRKLWERRGFMAAFTELCRRYGTGPRALAGPGGERRLTNYRHAAEILHALQTRERLGPEPLLARLRAEAAEAGEEAELRLESDARAVKIVTIHKSKGLEYDVVFCPFLWDARPVEDKPPVLARGADGAVYDFGSAEFAANRDRAETERLAEDVRLTYVALTRARHRCYAVWGDLGRGNARVSALAYLLHRRSGDGSAPLAELAAAGAGRWREELEKFAAVHADCMSFCDLPVPETAPELARARPEEAPAAAQVFPGGRGEQFKTWSLSSYSSIVRGREAETPDHRDPESQVAAAPVAPAGLHGFARGPAARGRAGQAGVCLHYILEKCDFVSPRGEANLALIRTALAEHGFLGQAAHAPGCDPEKAAAAMLEAVCEKKLPGEEFSLAEVERGQRLCEWQFHLPVADFSPGVLSGVFARHGTGICTEVYPEPLSRLDRATLDGFLTGFVDLVFERGGRWFIVDWKSNFLGPDDASYTAAGVAESMLSHHYVLQYHLYAVALQRFLRLRLPDYSYRRHFGGVFYCYLRGAATEGWYADRPPERLIAALDAALGGNA